ncbi:hypothetical protein HMPREF1548_01820 [Clostridium sp. KLE 1755]|nr:hypothetical protein HMPREF1548_01820 [Clostridium sp. KLE 1755]
MDCIRPGGRSRAAAGIFRGIGLLLDAVQFNGKGEQQPFYTGLVVRACVLHFIYDGLGQVMDMGIFRPGQDMSVISIGKQRKIRAGFGSRKQSAEQLGRIKHDIGPAAFRTLVRIGGMGNITGDAGDIPRFEGHGFAVELHGAAAGMAEADFQAVVEVQAAAGNIGYFPMLPA